jgi:hypothetical protein
VERRVEVPIIQEKQLIVPQLVEKIVTEKWECAKVVEVERIV